MTGSEETGGRSETASRPRRTARLVITRRVKSVETMSIKVVFLAALSAAVVLAQAPHNAYVWPVPASIARGPRRTTVQPKPGKGSFFTFVGGTDTPSTLAAAFERYHGITFPHVAAAGGTAEDIITGVAVKVEDLDESHPQLETDESYTLDINGGGVAAVLTAKTIYGALRGLETFSQLVEFDFEEETYFVDQMPVSIVDSPRFPHRGLMIDSSRHFETLATIRNVIDSLPYAKINVLHWHMVDAQSFPFQSKTFPRLWDGAYSEFEKFTQADIAEIVEYARLRGVRVIVEFDTPGHATSWCKGYPEICPSATCQTPLNVANNFTFQLIDGLLAECTGRKPRSGLFPDDMIHLGGDEVDTSCWTKTPAVQSWMNSRQMTADDAYAYFAKRVAASAIQQGRRPMQWSEVYDHFKTELPKDVIVHVWKGNTNLSEVAANGYDLVVNVGYFNESWYLDNLDVTWRAVYANDPCKNVPDALCPQILGGHGEMWGETVDTSDISQTIWPRLAAIAERLWSPRAMTVNVTDALPRIEYFRCLLNRRGVRAAPVNNPSARSPPTGPGSCLKQ